MKNKKRCSNTFLHPSLLPGLTFTLNFLYLLHWEAQGEWGLRLLISDAPSSPWGGGEEASHSSSAPEWDTSHRRQSFRTDSSGEGSLWGHKYCQQICSRCTPLSTGLHILQEACSSLGFPWDHSLLFLSIHMIWHGVLQGLLVVCVPLWTSIGWRDTTA